MKVPTQRPSVTTVIGLCAAILACNKNLHMNLVQRMIALILNCGHASKQVHILFYLSIYVY